MKRLASTGTGKTWPEHRESGGWFWAGFQAGVDRTFPDLLSGCCGSLSVLCTCYEIVSHAPISVQLVGALWRRGPRLQSRKVKSQVTGGEGMASWRGVIGQEEVLVWSQSRKVEFDFCSSISDFLKSCMMLVCHPLCHLYRKLRLSYSLWFLFFVQQTFTKPQLLIVE